MRRVETIHNLSPLQEGLLFHAAAGGAAGEYLVQFVLTLKDVEPALLRQALEDAVAANPALRCGFSWETVGRPVAVVMGGVGVPWTEEDWTGQAGGRLEACLAADRARGFQLTRPPLMRALLADEGDGRWRFILTYHHLLMDGWSASLLFEELDERYAALRDGRAPRLEPRRPYADFLAWMEGRDLDAAERYWRGVLARAPATGPPLASPQSGDRPAARLSARARVEPAAWQKACALGRGLGVTPAVLAAGAWALILARAQGEPDVLFGATIAGRPAELDGADRMIGLFINTVPIRTQAADHLPLGGFLRGLQQTMQDAGEHGHAPLARILGWAAPERASLQTLFVYENYPPAAAAARRRLGVVAGESREEAAFPASLLAEPEPDGGLGLCLSHDGTRLDRAAAVLLLERYARLLQAMADAGPDAAIGTIDHRVLSDVAITDGLQVRSAPADAPPLLPARFLAQAAERPDAPAVFWQDAAIGYGALAARALAVAAGIARRAPGPRPVVALAMERRPDLVAAALGAMLAGGAYLPLDLAQPQERIRSICAAAGAELLVCDRPDPGIDLGLPMLLVDDALPPAGGFAPAEIDADAPAYVIATSGSTGAPKPVAVSHGALSSLLAWAAQTYPPETLARVAFTTPVTFDVSVFELFAPLATGGAMVLYEDIVALDADPAACPTLMCGVPSLLGSFQPPASCRVINFAGEVLPQALADRVVGEGRLVQALYGPTETTVYATGGLLGAGEQVSLGRPFPHLSTYVLGPALRPVAAGEVGELYIAGPQLALGYLGRPGLTARAFLPDPFGAPGGRMYRTGDLVRLERDGRLAFIGRRDGLVKLRGQRIELGEVEAALHAAGLAPDEAAAVIVPGAAGRPRLVACITRAVDLAGLDAALAQRLPAGYRPQAVLQVAALPRTSSGKLDRKALAAEISRRPDQAGAGASDFRGPAERAVAAAIAGALGLDEIGPEDDFFALGGDSIVSLQAAALARKAGVRLGPEHVVRLRTPRAIAAALGEIGAVEAAPAPAGQSFPLGAIQKRFFEQSRANPHQFNQAILLTTDPDVDAGALAAAVLAVQSAHPGLRLRFTEGEGGWRQAHADGRAMLQRVDLSGAPTAAQAEAVTAACAHIQAGFDIRGGPVFAAVHFDLGRDRPGRLLLACHHLCVDGVSWRIILDDLASAYASAAAGGPIALEPEPAAFAAWVEAARRFARAPEREQDWRRWLALAEQPLAALPCEGEGEAKTGADREIRRVLDRETTGRLLRDAPLRHRAPITSILVGALGLTLADWCGGPVLLDLEGHGRHDFGAGLDLSRTVGWFTSLHPARLDIPPRSAAAEAVLVASQALADQCAEDASYGLLRYLSGDPRAEQLAMFKPQVLFNYLGQLDSIVAGAPVRGWASESVGPDEAAGEARSHLIEINAHTTGGELAVSWRFSPARHHDATIGRLADQHLRLLQSLAGGPERQPGSSFGLSEAARAKVLARLQAKP